MVENFPKIKSGTFPVFFIPKAVGKVIARLWKTILSGCARVQNASPLADQLGDKIFEYHCTPFQYPNFRPYTCVFDDEGLQTMVKTFIEAAIVKSFYWEKKWAAFSSDKSTGNGFWD